MLDLSSLRIAKWQPIIEKLKNRLQNWSFRSLNIVARMALLNSTLQSISIYPISVMEVLKGVCTKMTEIYRKFPMGRTKIVEKMGPMLMEQLKKT